MPYSARLADLHKLALRPSYLPLTPDAGPAVVAWYESLDRKPSTIDLLDMIAWALTDERKPSIQDILASLTPSEN